MIGSDVLALLLRDFVLGGGHENRVLVERERKMRCFLGGAIGLYIVEEGRRERTGGEGEEKKKGTLVSLFYFLCVFLVCRKRRVYTYLQYLDLGITYERGHFFDVVLFVLLSLLTWSILGTCHISVPDVHWKKEGVFFLQELFHTMSGLEECRHLEKPSKVQFAGSWYVFALSTSRVD